ncbi:MAG TPA: gfo/Idh/MocA family oxidoreductase [Acetobacteraceae bacterium]|jgi:predicted dehydrogenase|nr:gfo/Idh/MocA family oxidoreductase [Acetobacteraceae bacterium]
MINAAIVGLGWWGQNLVNSVRGSDAIRFTTAHTRNQAAAADFCAEAGLNWVGSLDAVLNDKSIDAVVFATPHTQHTDQVVRAAAAGKHTFIEKPFSLSLSDATRARAAADKAGIVLAVGFNRRFHPSMVMLRDAVTSGRLGTLVTISAEQTALHGISLSADAWRAKPEEAPVGAMTAIGVHLVDGMIDLFGRVAQVYAQVSRRAAPLADDTTDVMLRFANGASGHIFCSTAATPHYRMAVYGTEGFAEILGHPMATFRLVPAAGGAVHGGGAPRVTETPDFNMLNAELEAFAASIAAGRPFPTPLDQIMHGVAVFEAIAASAATGGPVTVTN